MKGMTFWLTGLPSSGKTTIAKRTANVLRTVYKTPVVVIDGDEVRKKVNFDVGYTLEERNKNIKKVAGICSILNKNDILVIASVVSPSRRVRDEARETIGNMREVYIKCPIKVCKDRDVKGYYRKYDRGEIHDFVGMNIEYEEPENPLLVLETNRQNVDVLCRKLVRKMFKELRCSNG